VPNDALELTIHEHAKDGNIDGVRSELAKGVDVDGRDPATGQTPLMIALQSRAANAELVKLLIEKGADVNSIKSPRPDDGESGKTVLSFAAQSGNLEKIKLVLDAGADIRYQLPHGYNVLIDVMFYCGVARDPHLVPIVRYLISRGAELNLVSDYSESALSVSSNMGRFDAVRMLLDAGANPSPLQWIPLMRAVALGSVDDVKAELQKQPDLAAKDFWSRTAWLISLQVGDVAKAKLLLAAGANRLDRGRCGKTPLMYPIINGHTEMLQWLLSEGFNPNDVDEFGGTPLMEAVENGAIESAKILIEHGADIHQERHSQAAIKLANDIATVRLLVSHGADLGDVNDEARASLTRVPHDGRILVTRDDYLAAKYRRFGKSNPEKMNIPFWMAMIKSGADAYEARSKFDDVNLLDEPVWCFKRFGRSITELPDGRIVEIAGEHEDYYDPDFCIYNDVVVHHGDGTFDIYGYPKECFPPTDFHTATLIGPFIYLIGNLGYQDERTYGQTQVFQLNIATLEMEKVKTSGEKPGWISDHKASHLGDGKIHISGGKICTRVNGKEQYSDNPGEFVLDLSTLRWTRVVATR
jgi:ankyrin repeat protein